MEPPSQSPAAPPDGEPAAPHDATPAAPRRAVGLPPWPVWLAAATAALLHALPFLRTRLADPGPGQAWIGVPYVAKDWLAYLAFVREQPRAGEALLANPFTTEPQGGRFVLLLHHVLGLVHRLTGADPGWLLELARTAAILAFAAVLWRFLEGFWPSARTRSWAVVLVLLSGGLGFLALSLAPLLPPELAATVNDELRSGYGWTTFEALYNPLWAVGLVLLLVALRPLLQPGGPRSARELAVAGAALLAAWFTHAYTALACVAIVAGALAAEWIATRRLPATRALRTAAAVAAPLLLAGLVGLWQRGDPVFARASGGVLGAQAVGISWYPVTFAAAGVLALRGFSAWSATGHPWRHALAGWVVAIALLHSSPILNGYHFLLYAYLPVAILAAEPVARAFGGLRRRGAAALAAAAALVLLLFASAPVTAARAFGKVEEFRIPSDAAAALGALAAEPPGNVLTFADLGNLVPAFGPHRVWVGQWFLTPDFEERSARASRTLVGGDAEDLRRIVQGEAIDLLLVPSAVAPALAAALSDLSPRVEPRGTLAIVRLRGR